MTDPNIHGLCPPRFAALRDAFAANFAEDLEMGARFTLAIAGEIVVDLMGGWADRGETRPFGEDILTPIHSTTKAVTAATFRAPSGPIPAGTTTPDPLLNLSLQNAALASGGKLTTLGGGIPVTVDNQIIGAIGVGGGTAEQDTVIARAGIEAFETALKPPPEASKEAAPAEK